MTDKNNASGQAFTKRARPSPATLHKLLRYEPETGKLFWKERGREWFSSDRDFKKWNTRYAGKEAFTASSHGYRAGAIFRHTHRAHRIIWAMIHGDPGCLTIDHINGDRADNRITNLRLVTHHDNTRNISLRSNSPYRVFGIRKNHRKWNARISVNGQDIFLGSFKTFDEAVAARRKAEARYGFHRNHGKAQNG